MNAYNYVENVLKTYVHQFSQILGSNFALMHDNVVRMFRNLGGQRSTYQ